MFVIKTISFLLAPLPDFAVMFLARLLFPLFYLAVKKGKWGLKTKKIIPRVFKDKDAKWQERVVRQNTLHLAKLAGEVFKIYSITGRGKERKVYIKEGREYFERLNASCEGFMIITCHLGNWEYGAGYLAHRYRTIYAPVFVEESGGNRALNWIRRGHNVVLLEASRDPRVSATTFFKMRDLLMKGEILYLVADQAALGGDVRGTLFGKKLRFFGGPYILGRKIRKPVLPMYTLRDERNKLGIHFEKPFYFDGAEIGDDVQKVLDFFERNIRVYPEQYLWSQNRW
jgi:lauroyl/myristoyl acyltransferase